MTRLSEREEALRLQTAVDFRAFAACLSIRTKGRGLVPFVLNRPQRIAHALFERQLREKGYVRKLVLKGRQMGISTYIQGRFYWRVTHRRGAKAAVVAHTNASSANMWVMLRRFHDHAPNVLRPETRRSNARELDFSALESGYAVGSAGGRDFGRSDTFQYVHLSEVAFFQANAASLVLGLMEAVPEPEEGESEVVQESTANGVGGSFHTEWRASEAGASDFERIFLAWFEYPLYRATPPEDWEAPPEFIEYGRQFQLSREQVFWAWRKNRAHAKIVGASPQERCWFFKQEYPATPVEAFQMSGKSFIPSHLVEAARKRRGESTGGPVIIGVDPASAEDSTAGDGTGVVDREGRALGKRVCERWYERNPMTLAGRIAQLNETWRPALIVVDTTDGLGRALVARLEELHYTNVYGVVFGARAVGVGPQPADRYLNRRAEMKDAQRSWFEDEVGVSIPDDDILHAEICAAQWGPGATRYTSERVLQIEPKESIKERLQRSPDLDDASLLTFAVPVPTPEAVEHLRPRESEAPQREFDPLEDFD